MLRFVARRRSRVDHLTDNWVHGGRSATATAQSAGWSAGITIDRLRPSGQPANDEEAFHLLPYLSHCAQQGALQSWFHTSGHGPGGGFVMSKARCSA